MEPHADQGSRATKEPGLSQRAAGDLLGATARAEVRLARSFRECRGLTVEQIEDIHQETVLALLSRNHESELHLAHALRVGIKQRALRLHRDTRRRLQILHAHARTVGQSTSAVQEEQDPAIEAGRRVERKLSVSFLAGLDALERELFMLDALEGAKYRAAATVLGVDLQAARRASRRAERKRAMFECLQHGWAGGVAA